MVMQLVTDTVEKDITFLEDADVEFVSLVRHGANQQPFRIIKAEGGKEMRVVQSILVPSGIDITDLTSQGGLGWLSEASVETKEEFEGYDKFVQRAPEEFDGALSLVKLHESGTYALIGKLADGVDQSKALTLGEVAKDIGIGAAPMDTPVATVEGPLYQITFRDMFEKELSSFLNVVRGAMSQSSADGTKRKKQVMTALDSFKNFLSIGLDELNKSKSRSKKEETSAVGELAEELIKALKTNTGGDEMFKDKNEFKTAVMEILEETGALKKDDKPDAQALALGAQEKGTEEAGKKDGDGAQVKEEDLNPEQEDKGQDRIEGVEKGLADLKKDLGSFMEQLGANPAGGESDDDLADGGEDSSGDEKPSVFAGIFSKKNTFGKRP